MISEKIKYIRNDLNLNQKDFANLLNVAQSTVSRIEKGERQPEYEFLRNFIIKFNINPDWIFFDKEPILLDVDDNFIVNQNNDLLKDISLILSPEELNKKLNDILFEHVLNQIATESEEDFSIVRKFFKTIKLEGHVPFRPLLFLYYIFRYIRDFNYELVEVTSYKDYLLDLIRRYKVLSFKNNPAFTSQIKKQFEISIEMNLTEHECKSLIINYEEFIKKIESKMTPIILYTHKKIDTKTLFPK